MLRDLRFRGESLALVYIRELVRKGGKYPTIYIACRSACEDADPMDTIFQLVRERPDKLYMAADKG
jgi:hypothetical protein